LRRIIRQLYVSIGIPFIVLCLSTSALSADRQQIRLAIVDVGTKVRVSGPCLDLLLVAFNKHKNVALLERSEIDRLLKEQALSLAMSNTDIIKAGRIWTSDAFLLLESAESKENSVLRLRLVDTRYGFKLWDVSMPFPAEAKEQQVLAATVAESAARIIRKTENALQKVTPLSLSNFKSEELSPRWDWLSDALATALEQNLALYPEVILMERRKTGPLMEERNLVADLPAELRPSAVFIDGDYRMQRDKGPDIVSVRLRCRKQDSVVLDTRIEGSVNNPGDLFRNLATTIRESLGNKPDAVPMDAAKESEMLAREAEVYLSIGNYALALSLAESSLALNPDSVESRILLAETLIKHAGIYLPQNISGKWNKPLPEGMERFYEAWMHGVSLMEGVLDHWPSLRNRDLSLKSGNTLRAYLDNIQNLFQIYARDNTHLSADNKKLLEDVCETYWHLYNHSFEILKNQGGALFVILTHIGAQSIPLCSNADHAVELAHKIVKEQIRMNLGTDVLDVFLRLVSSLKAPWFAEWPNEMASIEKVENLILRLLENQNETVRLCAERAAYNLYVIKQDYKKARDHCARLIELQKQNNFSIKEPLFRRTSILIGLPFGNEPTFSADSKEDTSIKLAFHLDILNAIFEKGLTRGIDQITFASTIRSVVAQLENEGKIKEADALLQRGLSEIQADRETAELKDFQSNFRKRHPEARVEQKVENCRERKAIKVFSRDSAKDTAGNPAESHFRRLILNDKVQAIVYSDSSSLKSTRFGIIRLSPEMKPVSSQLFPFPTRFKQYAQGYETHQYEKMDPLSPPIRMIFISESRREELLFNMETGAAK
jgi:tetratricopeptide (TPR) repeat protein